MELYNANYGTPNNTYTHYAMLFFQRLYNRIRRSINSTRHNLTVPVDIIIDNQNIENPPNYCSNYINSRKYLYKCLNCNRSNITIYKSKIEVDRTCSICLDNKNVRYGCYNCVHNGLQSCCENCYNEIVNMSVKYSIFQETHHVQTFNDSYLITV